MTVREFTNHTWYVQQILIIKWKTFDYIVHKFSSSIDKMKEMAVYVGTPHELSSATYDYINSMKVLSYGVVDNNLIIEVE